MVAEAKKIIHRSQTQFVALIFLRVWLIFLIGAASNKKVMMILVKNIIFIL